MAGRWPQGNYHWPISGAIENDNYTRKSEHWGVQNLYLYVSSGMQ